MEHFIYLPSSLENVAVQFGKVDSWLELHVRFGGQLLQLGIPVINRGVKICVNVNRLLHFGFDFNVVSVVLVQKLVEIHEVAEVSEFCDSLAVVQYLAHLTSFVLHLLSELIDYLATGLPDSFLYQLDDPILNGVEKVFDVLDLIYNVPIKVG